MTFIQAFHEAERLTDKVLAIIDNDEKITYGDLLKAANRLSNYFKESGLNAGAKVLLSTSDKRSFLELMLASYRYGLTLILIDPKSSIRRAQSVIETTKPDQFFLDEVLFDKWEVEREGHLIIKREASSKGGLFGKVFKKETQSQSPYYPKKFEKYPAKTGYFPTAFDVNSAAYIIFTSGTVSNPKGVVISYHALFTHLDTLKKVYKMSQNTVIFNNLNLFHADGVNQGPLLAFLLGATWVSPFEPNMSRLDLMFVAMYKYRITHLVTVPTILTFMMKYSQGFEDSFDTDDFKYIISVAAKLDQRLWSEFQVLFKTNIANVYGLTETVNGSLYAIPGNDSHKIGTVGMPVDCEIKVLDDNGKEAGSGELWMKGEHIMSGYYENQEETDKVLMDGWINTGDLVSILPTGHVSIIGRKKRMINSGGFRIHPEEIEEVLGELPIRESIVVGLDDELMVEKMLAFIEADEGSLTEQAVFQYLRTHLEPEKVPANLVFMNQFPRNTGGKVDIPKLKSLWQESKITTKNDLDVEEKTLQIAADTFKVVRHEISITSTPGNVAGWDSLNHFLLITNVEEAFDINFDTKEIMSMTTLAAISKIVKQKV
jgi:acyl-CoA synthetase (AMP-forming)/AMP-acid ligase II/acyl carrier protein